jgi:hypothetical protein
MALSWFPPRSLRNLRFLVRDADYAENAAEKHFDSKTKSPNRRVLIHHLQDVAGQQPAGNAGGAEESADHAVFIDEHGRWRGDVLTVFACSNMQHLDRIDQFVVGVCHDDQMRKFLFSLSPRSRGHIRSDSWQTDYQSLFQSYHEYIKQFLKKNISR